MLPTGTTEYVKYKSHIASYITELFIVSDDVTGYVWCLGQRKEIERVSDVLNDPDVIIVLRS